jgi:hypothetical protein
MPATDIAPDPYDIYLIHRVFRREFPRLAGDIASALAAGDSGRSAALVDHWALLDFFLEHHHDGEDLLLWPPLESAAAEDAAVVARMRAEHDELLVRLAAARAALAPWTGSGGTLPPADGYADVLDALADHLVSHLDDEEALVVPLVTAHLTAGQWAALGEHGRGGMDPERAFTFLGLILEDADEEERAKFTAEMPPPALEAFRSFGEPAYREYVAVLRG